MKKLLLCAFALPILTLHFSPQASAAPAKKAAAKAKVNWRASFPAALAESKRTGRPIFVDFYTTWCGPCKYLDAVTYKDPKFVAESKKWIMVKVDAEKNKSNIALAQKYKIEGFPSMLFLKSNGQEAARAVGGYPAKLLVPEMKKALVKAAGGQQI